MHPFRLSLPRQTASLRRPILAHSTVYQGRDGMVAAADLLMVVGEMLPWLFASWWREGSRELRSEYVGQLWVSCILQVLTSGDT